MVYVCGVVVKVSHRSANNYTNVGLYQRRLLLDNIVLRVFKSSGSQCYGKLCRLVSQLDGS